MLYKATVPIVIIASEPAGEAEAEAEWEENLEGITGR
jgi:hypothetical protein